jgi:hypothetical protein
VESAQDTFLRDRAQARHEKLQRVEPTEIKKYHSDLQTQLTGIQQPVIKTKPSTELVRTAQPRKPVLSSIIHGASQRVQSSGQKFAQTHPVIANTIRTPFEHAAVGMRYGAGQNIDMSRYAPVKDVTPFSQYHTVGMYHGATARGEDWRHRIDTYQPTPPVGEGIGARVKYEVHEGLIGVAHTPGTVMTMAGQLALGAEYLIREPKQAAAGIPIGAGVMIGGTMQAFRDRPSRTIGEFAGMAWGPRAIGGAVRAAPTPKIPQWVPKSRAMTNTHGRVPASIEVAKSIEGLTPEKTIKFETGHQLTKAVETTKLPTKPVDFANVKYLPEKAGPAVEQWIRTHPQQDPVIGGSTAAQAHFPSARRGADIDILVRDPKSAGAELFKIVQKELGPERVRLVDDPKWDACAVETRAAAGGRWHHGVDIHRTVDPGSSLRYGFETQKPITVEGIKYQQAGELISRKAESVLQPSSPGTIGPTQTFRPQRIKDIKDYETYISDVLKLRKEQAESARFFSGHKVKKVEKLEDVFEGYKMHSYMGPDPYMIASAAKAYGKTPLYGRTAVAVAGIGSHYGRYPTVHREPSTYDKYPIASKEDYPQPEYPVPAKGVYGTGYKPALVEKYNNVTPPDDPYTSPYTPPRDTPYDPSYTPPSTPVRPTPVRPTPYDPSPLVTHGFTPPKQPPKIPKLKFAGDDTKKEPRDYPLTQTKKKAFHPWFPASLEYVNVEESMTGKRAVHIRGRETTQKLFKGLITSGKGIMTKSQYARSKKL